MECGNYRHWLCSQLRSSYCCSRSARRLRGWYCSWICLRFLNDLSSIFSGEEDCYDELCQCRIRYIISHHFFWLPAYNIFRCLWWTLCLRNSDHGQASRSFWLVLFKTSFTVQDQRLVNFAFPAWRWLFIIEGSFSLVIGGICWLTFPTSPDTAWFLNSEEKELMALRKKRNAAFRGEEKFDTKWVKVAFTDPFVYLASLAFFTSSVAIFGFGTFLPTIIKGLGYVFWCTLPLQPFTNLSLVSPL